LVRDPHDPSSARGGSRTDSRAHITWMQQCNSLKVHDQFLLKNSQLSNQQRLAMAQAYVKLFLNSNN